MPGPGEFEIIERWFRRSGHAAQATPAAGADTDAASGAAADSTGVRVGIGDDAAVVEVSGPLAVAVDMLVAGNHFPTDLPAQAVGHRALAVNLSDLAAVGARPRWATLALALSEVDPDWLDAFAEGLFGLAERFEVALVGGDTTRGPLNVTVTVLGEASASPLLRAGGQPGDRILVSGTLGDSAAALAPLKRPAGERTAAEAALVERFCFPEPRIALGRALLGCARAAIDISDGLLADLGHICAASGCGAELDLAALPLSPSLSALHEPAAARDFALGGGDDYELCFTVAPEAVGRARALAAEAGTPVTEIGELTDRPGIVGLDGDARVELDARGYVHF